MGQWAEWSESGFGTNGSVFALFWCSLVHGLFNGSPWISFFAEENHRPVLLTQKCIVKGPLSASVSLHFRVTDPDSLNYIRSHFNLFMRICFIKTIHSEVRGSADKSLARPTSRCRRTESIVSLERGVCSCTELQVFSCYRGWKEACQATRAISTTSRRELS